MEQPRHAKVERVVEDGQTRLVVRGRLDRDSAPAVLDWIRAWLPRRAGKVGLDLGQVELLDSAGVAILAETLEMAAKRGCVMELVRVSAPAQRTLEMFHFADEVEAAPAESGRLLQSLGEWLVHALSSTQRLFLLMADTFYWALIGPFSSGRGAPKGELTRQTILLGSKAFGIVALMASTARSRAPA